MSNMQKNIFSEENLPVLQALQKNIPNNMELGKQIRKSFRDFTFVMAFPNDLDLGREVRKILLEKK